MTAGLGGLDGLSEGRWEGGGGGGVCTNACASHANSRAVSIAYTATFGLRTQATPSLYFSQQTLGTADGSQPATKQAARAHLESTVLKNLLDSDRLVGLA